MTRHDGHDYTVWRNGALAGNVIRGRARVHSRVLSTHVSQQQAIGGGQNTNAGRRQFVIIVEIFDKSGWSAGRRRTVNGYHISGSDLKSFFWRMRVRKRLHLG